MPEKNQQLSEVIFGWRSPEEERLARGLWWHVAAWVVLALAAWWSISDGNYLFIVFLVLFYLVIVMHDGRAVKEVDFIITPDGVKMSSYFYRYSMFDNFFIIYQDQGVQNLYLDFKNPLRGRLVVSLAGQNAVAVREYLLNFLSEDLDRETEPISEQLRRWLRL